MLLNREIRKLAEKYDMTNIDEYKIELEKIFGEKKYRKAKGLRLYVLDMEDGNTSLTSPPGRNADMVYEKDVDYNNVNIFTEYLGYNGKDFLDKNGNIVNPEIYSEQFFYFQSKTLVSVSFVLGIFSIIGYFILTLKIYLMKNNISI